MVSNHNPPPPMKEKLPQLSGRTNENAGKSVLLLSFVWMFFTEDDGDWAENVPNVESFLLIFFFYFYRDPAEENFSI